MPWTHAVTKIPILWKFTVWWKFSDWVSWLTCAVSSIMDNVRCSSENPCFFRDIAAKKSFKISLKLSEKCENDHQVFSLRSEIFEQKWSWSIFFKIFRKVRKNDCRTFSRQKSSHWRDSRYIWKSRICVRLRHTFTFSYFIFDTYAVPDHSLWPLDALRMPGFFLLWVLSRKWFVLHENPPHTVIIHTFESVFFPMVCPTSLAGSTLMWHIWPYNR